MALAVRQPPPPLQGPLIEPQRRDFTTEPTPGALQVGDFPLEYYDDGYPKLPESLDRRKQRSVAA